ncbi:hypothetical protein KBTX_02675 [wastewater metagenome]|uniref:PilZ domain-containing protein n=2 Tax=unclassified sequences TaxID=12908 RepID=A0A5B8RE18_9ZZZZ|nr:hypothetical protein [Arhodomonas aquaeolei]MCS4503433.1 hypothetical protein [Arhodomonas aquaeolei]QEA06343.1 hypothetical protein KBTEX_02675 [uncultured organism]
MAREKGRHRRRLGRVEADLRVAVYLRGRRLGEYRTRDVNRAGIGLRPGRIMLWPGLKVEVQLYSAVAERPMPRRIPAVVCYVRASGMGIRFNSAVPSVKEAHR